jgi:hypothetical protein
MENRAKSSEKSKKGGWIFLLAGFVGALIIGWVIFPMVLYSKQPQPLNFNHAIHLNPDKVEGIEGDTEAERCEFCHGFRDDGTFVGIPKLSTCTQCHDDPESPLSDLPTEAIFLKKYVATGTQVPWLSYFKQPECVYFSHIAHVKMGKIACKTCHGDYGHLAKLPLYEANRLTGYSINIWGKRISGYKKHTWDSMKMDDCADCHKKMGHPEDNACFVCHK